MGVRALFDGPIFSRSEAPANSRGLGIYLDPCLGMDHQIESNGLGRRKAEATATPIDGLTIGVFRF